MQLALLSQQTVAVPAADDQVLDPRVLTMPPLTFRCPVCGNVETPTKHRVPWRWCHNDDAHGQRGVKRRARMEIVDEPAGSVRSAA